MKCSLTSSLILASLLAVSAVRCDISQAEIEKQMNEISQIVFSPMTTVEPIEMYVYLTALKKLKGAFEGEPGFHLGIMSEVDQDLDDLIEAFNITSKKCSREWFLKLQKMMRYYENKMQFWNYVNHQKRKLSELCLDYYKSNNGSAF